MTAFCYQNKFNPCKANIGSPQGAAGLKEYLSFYTTYSFYQGTLYLVSGYIL